MADTKNERLFLVTVKLLAETINKGLDKTTTGDEWESNLIFLSYLPHTNLDSCVFVLSRNLMKLSIPFVFRSFTEKIILAVISLIDPNIF
jgi:hypothetical protein